MKSLETIVAFLDRNHIKAFADESHNGLQLKFRENARVAVLTIPRFSRKRPGKAQMVNFCHQA